MRIGRPSLRRSPTLVAYWDGDNLVIENFVTRQRYEVGTGIIEVLDQFSSWASPQLVFQNLSGEALDEMRNAISSLKAGSFLETKKKQSSKYDRTTTTWKTWHPAASYFHFATKDPPYANSTRAYSEVERGLRERASTRPAVDKRFRRGTPTRLPTPLTCGEFPQVLLRRRTWRRFGPGPLELQSLSTVLALSFGVQWKLKADLVGTFSFTTSPSGGARHPLETYVLVQRVRGLRPGVYHYQKDRHELIHLGRAPSRQGIATYFPGQSWCANAPVIVFLTAVFPRTLWKYPHPRAYRVVLAEAGHVCQTFCLVSTWLQLAPYCTMALADSKVERSLGVDGVQESVLYAAGVGTRPSECGWAPLPDQNEALPAPRATRVIPRAQLPVLKL